MTYEEPGCTITLTENCLTFSGQLECFDYGDVAEFLRQVDRTLTMPMCILDLKNLRFLNSSGIETIATFVLGSSKRFEIRIDSRYTWQKTTIGSLQALKSQEITVVS